MSLKKSISILTRCTSLASSYIYKVILGGAALSGKTSFLNGTPFHEDDCSYIGVSFKLMDCVVNDEDDYTLQIWDFNDKERYRFLFPSFCLGAKAALLCFDMSDVRSFDQLPYWTELVRTHNPLLPIILIGTKIDLDPAITPEEVEKFKQNYGIEHVYYTSITEPNRKENIFRDLIEMMNPEANIEDFFTRQPENLSPLEDQNFRDFLNAFAICPVCKRENHYSYLKKFYYSKSKSTMKLKQALLDLINQSMEEVYYNEISIGIPCCACFKKFCE